MGSIMCPGLPSGGGGGPNRGGAGRAGGRGKGGGVLGRGNAVRKKGGGDLKGWMAVAGSKEGVVGAEYVRALRALLTELKVDGQIEQWVRAARLGGAADAELAQVHEQAWRQVVELL